MILSLFIRNKEFHVACGDFASIYKVTESREMADNIPSFLNEALRQVKFDDCTRLIYSSGPASFTTARIMNSVIKGFKIAKPNLEFLGLSNFLTYLYIASRSISEGTIAIPTMRGDYFTASYSDKKLSDIEIMPELPQSTILDADKIFDNINLSLIQKEILNDSIVQVNPKYIQSNLNIKYGFTPEYKNTTAQFR